MSERTATWLGWGTISLLVLAGVPAVVLAQDATAILADYTRRTSSQSEEYTGEVVVRAASGTERRRAWRSYREGSGQSVNRLIRFISPPEVRDVAFLSRSRPTGPPDQWLYLPSMKRERRIASQDRDAPFVGTDFSFEDMDTLDFSRFEARLLADESVDGHASHAIELRPRNPSGYERLVVVMRKDLPRIVRIDHYAMGDRAPAKQLRFSEFTETDGHVAPRRLVMADLRKGSQTTITLTSVRFDVPQPPDRFTLRNLVREGGDDGRRESCADCVDERPWRPRAARGPIARCLICPPLVVPRGTSSGLAPFQDPVTRPWTLSGYLEGRGFGFLPASPVGEPRAVAWGTAQIRGQARVGRARLVAAARAEALPAAERRSFTFDPADREVRRTPVSVRELSMTVPLGSTLEVETGRFVLDWSATDVYSPADAFLPRDLSDLFSPEKIPTWGVSVRGEHGRLRTEAYASFLTTPWRLPRMDGRYSPFGFAEVYLLDPSAAPPTRGFQAVRARWTSRAVDLGVWARAGVRPAPILTGDLDAADQLGDRRFVQLDRRFANERGLGIQASREVAQWMLRGEIGVLRSTDLDLGNAVLWTLEAQRAFRTGVLTATVAGNALESPQASVLYFDRAFLPAFAIGVDQREPWGNWTISWLGTHRKIGGLLKVDVVRQIGDHVTATLGADLPDGARLDSFGAFGRARRLRAALRYSWQTRPS